jgi:beta-glucosidase
MLAHGLALPRMRAYGKAAKHGITLNLNPAVVWSPSQEAQKEADYFDGDFNRWYLDSLIKGHYPEDIKRAYESRGYIDSREGWSFVKPGDLETISQPVDFLGVNFYTRAVFGRTRTAEEEMSVLADPTKYTAMGWEICPGDLEALMVRLHRDYPMDAYYITENGAAFEDTVEKDGKIHDHYRLDYYRQHLEKVQSICARGIPLKGYFAWSLMDNFEWAHGYAKRFGLVHVDYQDQKRRPKDSFGFYQQVLKDHAI